MLIFVIEVCVLCKVYKEMVVVDGFLFEVVLGELFGLFGFNGVGKLIMMWMVGVVLTCIVGELCILGFDFNDYGFEICV